MNLSVAVWMDQGAVLCVVCPTECFIHNVVVVPSRYLGNRMATDWADASLFLPEIHQSSSSLQGLFHLYAQAFFKIEFPCRFVGVAIPFDLGLLSDGCCGSQAQPVLDGFTTLLFCRAEEAPVLVSASAKIPVLHPLLALLWMSPFCPSPQHFEDGSIYTDKGFFGICVSMIVRPSPYFGVECRYQPVCCSLFVILNDFSDVRKELSLSRLNHGQPGVQAHPEIVQSTAELHDEIADALLPQADPVFHNATTLDAAVDMLDPQPPLVERLVGQVLLQGQLPTARLLRRHEDLYLGQREGQEAQILQQPAPRREGVGSGLHDAQIMDTAAVGIAEKEDREQGIDEQDIFDGVVFFLPAITLLLFTRVLGADDAPFGPVMGKRGEAGTVAGMGTTGAGSSSSG